MKTAVVVVLPRLPDSTLKFILFSTKIKCFYCCETLFARFIYTFPVGIWEWERGLRQ